MDVEGLGVAHVVGAPHPIDEGVASEHPTGVGQEQREQLELLEGQGHVGPPDPHLVALGVEVHVAHLDHAVDPAQSVVHCGAHRHPAQRSPDAGHELSQPVGLGHVVVGPHL